MNGGRRNTHGNFKDGNGGERAVGVVGDLETYQNQCERRSVGMWGRNTKCMSDVSDLQITELTLQRRIL